MTIKEMMYPVKIGKGLKHFGGDKDYYLYQKTDRVVLVDYATKAEAKAAKEIHDWIRGIMLRKKRIKK